MTLPILTTGASFATTKESLTQFTQTIQGDTVVTVPAVSLVTESKDWILKNPLIQTFIYLMDYD